MVTGRAACVPWAWERWGRYRLRLGKWRGEPFNPGDGAGLGQAVQECRLLYRDLLGHRPGASSLFTTVSELCGCK